MENPRKRARLQEYNDQSQSQSQTQSQSQIDETQKAWETTKNEIQQMLKDVCKKCTLLPPSLDCFPITGEHNDFKEMGIFLKSLCYYTGPLIFQPTFVTNKDFRYATKYFIKFMELLSRELFPEKPSEKDKETMEMSFIKYEAYYKKYISTVVHNLIFYASALPVYDIAHCHELEKCLEAYTKIIYLKTHGGEELTKQLFGYVRAALTYAGQVGTTPLRPNLALALRESFNSQLLAGVSMFDQKDTQSSTEIENQAIADMKKLHFHDIEQVMNLISSCLQVLSRTPPQPGKEFQEWPNCLYMRTLLAIEERPAFLPIIRYISSRINSETFSSKSTISHELMKSLGVFIQRVSSCPKSVAEEPYETDTPEDLTFNQLVSRELNELVKLLNIIELNLKFADPDVAHDLFLYIQPVYQQIHNIPDSALVDQQKKDPSDPKKKKIIPLIESIDSLMESFYKKVEFKEDPEVFNQIKVAQILVWVFSNRKKFGDFHEAADKIVKKIFEDGMLDGVKLILYAVRTEMEDIDQIPNSFPDRNLELYKLLVALVLKNMNQKVNDSMEMSASEIEDLNENILDLFRLCLELFPGFESAQMATFDTLISSIRKRHLKFYDIKQFTTQLFTTPIKTKKRIESLEQISDLLGRSNVGANLEFQNLLKNPATFRGASKVTTKTFPRITHRLKEMANNPDWKHNAVQLLFPILNILSNLPEEVDQFDIYPFRANGKFTFIVSKKSTNYKQMTRYMPYMIDSKFMKILRDHLTDESFLVACSEAVQQLSKAICESPSISYKDSERDIVVQFLLAPIFHGKTYFDDSMLRALKKLAPEEKLSNLTYFVTEFEKNVDAVSPKQLGKMARFVYKTDTECFKQIIGSLFDKTALIRIDSEDTKELTDLINEMHIYDQVYLPDMIQCIYNSSSRIRKNEGGFTIFESYVNNALGCVLHNQLWVDEPLVDRNLQIYIRLFLYCFNDGDQTMLDSYKKHALFYAEDDDEMFLEMFTSVVKRSFAEIFYFDNPKALWSEATRMLPGLGGIEKHMYHYAIEDYGDTICDSTIADVITKNILNEMYINKRFDYDLNELIVKHIDQTTSKMKTFNPDADSIIYHMKSLKDPSAAVFKTISDVLHKSGKFMMHQQKYLVDPSEINQYNLTWSTLKYIILLKALSEDHLIEFYYQFLPIFTMMMDHSFLRPLGLICWTDIEKILKKNKKMKEEIQIELIQPILALIKGLQDVNDSNKDVYRSKIQNLLALRPSKTDSAYNQFNFVQQYFLRNKSFSFGVPHLVTGPKMKEFSFRSKSSRDEFQEILIAHIAVLPSSAEETSNSVTPLPIQEYALEQIGILFASAKERLLVVNTFPEVIKDLKYRMALCDQESSQISLLISKLAPFLLTDGGWLPTNSIMNSSSEDANMFPYHANAKHGINSKWFKNKFLKAYAEVIINGNLNHKNKIHKNKQYMLCYCWREIEEGWSLDESDLEQNVQKTLRSVRKIVGYVKSYMTIKAREEPKEVLKYYSLNIKKRYSDKAISRVFWAKIGMQSKVYGPNEQMYTHLQFFNSLMLTIMTKFGLDAVEPKLFKRLVNSTEIKDLASIPESFFNLQESIFLGTFVEFIPGTTSNKSKKEYNAYRDAVVYDVCKMFSLVNAEFVESQFYSQKINCDAMKNPRRIELQRMIRMTLAIWSQLNNKIQALKIRLASEFETSKMRNKNAMLKIEITQQKTYPELAACVDIYKKANFALLGLGAYHVNDYVTAINYFEQAIMNKVEYIGGKVSKDEIIQLNKDKVMELLSECYHQAGQFDEVGGLGRKMKEKVKSEARMTSLPHEVQAMSAKFANKNDILLKETRLLERHMPCKVESVDDLIEIVDQMRMDGELSSSLDLAKLYSVTKDSKFSEYSVSAMIELGKWEDAKLEHDHCATSDQTTGFQFRYNDIILKYRNKMVSEAGIIESNSLSELKDILQIARRENPVQLRELPSIRDRSIVQMSLLEDIEKLFDWIQKRPEDHLDEMTEDVYQQWDTKRALFSYDYQDFLLDKHCQFLNLSKENIKNKEVENLFSNLLAITYLTRSMICSKRGRPDKAFRNIFLARSFKNDSVFDWEISLEEARQVVGRNDDSNMGRQVGNNLMEAYSKLKNLSGRTDGKSETMAKCKTLLALLCSEYDYDVINVSKMNAQKLNADNLKAIREKKYREVRSHFDSAIVVAEPKQNGAKCDAYYKLGLYLDNHFRAHPDRERWLKFWNEMAYYQKNKSKMDQSKLKKFELQMSQTREESVPVCNHDRSFVNLAVESIQMFQKSIIQGNKHAEDSLYKILGIVCDTADNLSDGLKPTNTESRLFEMFNVHKVERKLFETFKNALQNLPPENGLFLMSQLLGRLSTSCQPFRKALHDIVLHIFISYPDQVMWQLLHPIHNADNRYKNHKGTNDRDKEIGNLLNKLLEQITDLSLRSKISDYKKMGKLFCKLILEKPSTSRIKISLKDMPFGQQIVNLFSREEKKFLVPLKRSIVPNLHDRNGLDDDDFMYNTPDRETPSQAVEKAKSKALRGIYISQIEPQCSVMSSLQRPKKFSVIASNGQRYSFLAKNGDDLSLDARVSEIFQLFDFFLATDPKTRARNLGVRSYHVTPLGPEMGLIEWVSDLTSFKGAVCPLYSRESKHDIQTNYQPQYKVDKKDFEHYKKIMEVMNPPLFHQWFLDQFHTGENWLKARTTYTNSLAVTSIIGNILGLGDRHCENVQICKKTGELVHIDLNMIFERGLELRVPEIVPFRMTPNIVDGCGVTGLDGNFRTIAIMTMRLAKEKEKMLRTVISLFLADPTINWNNFKTRDNKRDSFSGNGKKSETSNQKSLIDVMNRIHCITKDNEALSEAEYLDHLLEIATSPQNLAKMWRGWAPQI